VQDAKSKVEHRIHREAVLHPGMKLDERKQVTFKESLRLLLYRSTIQLLRDAKQILTDVLLLILFAFISGIIYGTSWSLTDFSLVCMLSVLSLGLLATHSSSKIFSNERLNFWREASSGTSINAYFFSKLIVFTCFQNILYPFIFSGTFYDLVSPQMPYSTFYAIFLVTFWYCSGMGLLFSIVFNPHTCFLVSIIAPLASGAFLSGLSPYLNSMSPFLKSLCQISFSRWGVKALLKAESMKFPEFQHDSFFFQGYDDDAGAIKASILWMFLLGLFLRMAAFIGIHTSNRKKML
jgi:hypothetical protein